MDPVTRIEAALVSVTVRVAVCPEEMVLGLAVIETVGAEAAALAVNTETATKVRIGAREGIVFTGPALILLIRGGVGRASWIDQSFPSLRCSRSVDKLARVAISVFGRSPPEAILNNTGSL